MTITQTVEIPDSRRLHFDLEIPHEVPTGRAYLETKVIPLGKKEEKSDKSLLSMRGSCKGLDTMDAYFARKRAEKALEDCITKSV